MCGVVRTEWVEDEYEFKICTDCLQDLDFYKEYNRKLNDTSHTKETEET